VLITDERVQRFDTLFPGADIFSVPSATPNDRGLVGMVKALPAILSGIVQAFGILGRVKPSVVVGFGGYPTLPPLVAAILRRVPSCVHEQNAVLGRVNRLVAPYVHAIASTFAGPKFLQARDAERLVLTGNPVRDAVMAHAASPYVAPGGEGRIELLVFGGSQGARVMSDIVPGALARLPASMRARLHVVQQARPEDIDRVRAQYRDAGIAADLESFFDDMPARIAASHLVIGRSGASTVAELSIIGRPSILVPLPHSLDNDQKANAEKLHAAGASVMIEQKNFSEERLGGVLMEMFTDSNALAASARAALGQGAPDAVQRLADLVEALGRGEFKSAHAHQVLVDESGPSGPLLFALEDC
jgi:UDP-N-acetylglucosamine--N-acetylmuramyl-(pentapeptide) pyrophosphoryl-undecaprenol N-acetylglucosamine transferase